MFTKKNIQKALLDNFSATVRSQGEFYFVKDMVTEVEVTDDVTYAEVEGNRGYTYDIEIYWLDDEFMSECDCAVGFNCKHVAAVLYEILAFISSNPDKLDETDLDLEDVQLSGSHSGEFRKLPLGKMNIYSLVNMLSNRGFSPLDWHESYEGIFTSNTELSIESFSKFSYSSKNNGNKIILKKEPQGVFIKCLICNKKTDKFCNHQATLMHATASVLDKSGFLEGDFDFSHIIEQATKSSGVHPEAFHKYFQVRLNAQGFTVGAIKGNVVNTNWINSSNKLLDTQKELRKENSDKQISLLEEGRKIKHAFVWFESSYEDEDIGLRFMHGPGLKTKEGIQSSGRKVELLPKRFPKPQQAIGQQLFFAVQEPDEQKRFHDVKNIIQENYILLNEIYQFTYHQSPDYGSIRNTELNLATFHPTALNCRFSLKKIDGLVQLSRFASVDDQEFDFSKVIFSNNIFSATKDKMYLHPNHRFEEFMSMFGELDSLIIPYTDRKDFTKLVNGFKQFFEVEVEDGLIMKEETLTNPEYQILLREVGNFVLFEPRLKYGEYSFNAFDEDSYYINRKVFRVDQADQEFLTHFLKNTHPQFDSEFQVQDYVFLEVKELLNNYWFARFNEACEAAGIAVLGQDQLSKFKYSKHRAVTFSHVNSGIDWFEVDMGVSFGEEKVKAADWIRALRNKESFVRLKDGTMGILPEEWLAHARKILAVADIEKGNIKISKYRFNVIEDLFENIDDKKVLKELKAKKKKLAEYDTSKKYSIPKIVSADLRPYQKHGYTWLKFLDESEFGGILADDMGLGKTLQVITLLADQIDADPSLVIVPRTLLFNWSAELDKFCDSLKYTVHHGQGRAKTLEELFPINVIITTYDTAASDIEMFKDFKFNYIILDESQAIKNPDSKRYKAMRLLQSRNKLAMTGTPIENNTFDLYAQLSFTSPGLLGSKTSFKNSFAVPIDNHGDLDAANLLRKLIHPFLLRRTKEQVAKDLPAKTESIIYCDMGATQRKLYTKLKKQIKLDIEAEVEEKGIARSKFKMLDGLLRLRQMCNSPLLLNDAFSGANAESVKINVLLQNITEELDNHNALVFSQFVSLLSIVRKELDKRGIKYAYLDGSTNKRQAEVEKFMQTDDIKIFLISLKAGNTGMNLTKADYVYILDPWWNPAVEAQAIDRTHRIGQDKQIFAYKLICKDSIEEKILKLQEKKKALARDIIRTDENVLKSLKKDELMALFD